MTQMQYEKAKLKMIIKAKKFMQKKLKNVAYQHIGVGTNNKLKVIKSSLVRVAIDGFTGKPIYMHEKNLYI